MQTAGLAAGRGTVAPVAIAIAVGPLPLGTVELLSVSLSTARGVGGPWGTGTRKRPAARHVAVGGAALPLMLELHAAAALPAAPTRTTWGSALPARTRFLLPRWLPLHRRTICLSSPGGTSSPTYGAALARYPMAVVTAAPFPLPMNIPPTLRTRRGDGDRPLPPRQWRQIPPPACLLASPRCRALTRATLPSRIDSRAAKLVPQPAADPAPFCRLFQRSRDRRPPWPLSLPCHPLGTRTGRCTARRRTTYAPHVR